MCFFVTIAVPSNAVERVRTAHVARGMHIAPTANASARAAAGPGRVPLLVTTGGCSCDWYKPPSGSEAESKIANARARYERMGWSSAKIERALEGMARSPRHELGLHPVVREFLCAVARDCGSVAVWVHDFARDAEVEPYTMTKRENWAWSAILAQAAALATDTIAEISAERAASKG
jgi:hypothetical protein